MIFECVLKHHNGVKRERAADKCLHSELSVELVELKQHYPNAYAYKQVIKVQLIIGLLIWLLKDARLTLALEKLYEKKLYCFKVPSIRILAAFLAYLMAPEPRFICSA